MAKVKNELSEIEKLVLRESLKDLELKNWPKGESVVTVFGKPIKDLIEKEVEWLK